MVKPLPLEVKHSITLRRCTTFSTFIHSFILSLVLLYCLQNVVYIHLLFFTFSPFHTLLNTLHSVYQLYHSTEIALAKVNYVLYDSISSWDSLMYVQQSERQIIKTLYFTGYWRKEEMKAKDDSQISLITRLLHLQPASQGNF